MNEVIVLAHCRLRMDSCTVTNLIWITQCEQRGDEKSSQAP